MCFLHTNENEKVFAFKYALLWVIYRLWRVPLLIGKSGTYWEIKYWFYCVTINLYSRCSFKVHSLFLSLQVRQEKSSQLLWQQIKTVNRTIVKVTNLMFFITAHGLNLHVFHSRWERLLLDHWSDCFVLVQGLLGSQFWEQPPLLG